MPFSCVSASLMTSLVDVPAQALANMSTTTYLARLSANCRLGGAGQPGRCALASAHLPGWPAPASRHLAESVAKYIVVDMFAKACAGASTPEVIKNAEAQLKDIYRSA